MKLVSMKWRWHVMSGLAVLALMISFLAGAAFAQQGGVTDDTKPSLGPEKPLETQLNTEKREGVGTFASTTTGGTINAVRAVREDVAGSTSSTTFVDIPGASTSITVPAGQQGLFLATFSAESVCSGGNGWCSIRIMISGPSGTFEMLPAAGSDFAFDSTDGGTETASSWEGHSVQRAFSVGSGTWTVTAQQMVTLNTMTFRLDDWVLRVDKATFP